MSFENKGSMGATIIISREPDRSGNFVCDGVADEVQINAAIGLVTAGGRILLLEGTYNLAAGIDVNDAGITIQGQGCSIVGAFENTVLRLANGANTYIFNATGNNTIIKDLVLDGNFANNGAGTFGIYSSGEDSWFENLCIMNCQGTGLHIVSNFNSVINVFSEGGQNHGVYIGSNTSSFHYVLSYRNAKHGFHIHGAQDCSFTNCYAVGNSQVTNNAWDGFHLDSDDGTYSLRNSFVNCFTFNPFANDQRYGFRENDDAQGDHGSGQAAVGEHPARGTGTPPR